MRKSTLYRDKKHAELYADWWKIRGYKTIVRQEKGKGIYPSGWRVYVSAGKTSRR